MRGLNVGSGALRDALKDEGSNVGGATRLLLPSSLSSCSSCMMFCGGGASILMCSSRWLVFGEKWEGWKEKAMGKFFLFFLCFLARAKTHYQCLGRTKRTKTGQPSTQELHVPTTHSLSLSHTHTHTRTWYRVPAQRFLLSGKAWDGTILAAVSLRHA